MSPGRLVCKSNMDIPPGSLCGSLIRHFVSLLASTPALTLPSITSFHLVCSGLLAVLTLHACPRHKGFPSFSLIMFFPQRAKELTPFFMSLLKYHLLTVLYEKARQPFKCQNFFLYKLFIDIYMCVRVCVSVSVWIETAQILSVCLINFHKVKISQSETALYLKCWNFEFYL